MLFASALASEDKTLGMSKYNPASSCNEIYQRNNSSRGTIGQYWIVTDEGLFEVKCNMKLKCGGVAGGWLKVIDVDMNRDGSCPGTWHKITTPKRLCLGYISGCASAHFYMKGISYEHICGQAKGYQKGLTDAYHRNQHSLDDVYVDGISITVGSPRKHVWTYAAGYSDGYDSVANCPCAAHPGPSPAAFVGNDYYCESGNTEKADDSYYYLSDPLWDGAGVIVAMVVVLNLVCHGSTGEYR